jgi:hypothetical protein
MHSWSEIEARRHQAWVEDKVDEEIAKNNPVEEAAEYTLTAGKAVCLKKLLPSEWLSEKVTTREAIASKNCHKLD